ncbi:ankyrin repeat domain-containing protein [Vibrio kasasachensis]|uniref:ankyrin repeat domain-containing protein n=1 Tax=Vibrio kasasachensis TaxID=2910248 RepID=UPI003D0BE594
MSYVDSPEFKFYEALRDGEIDEVVAFQKQGIDVLKVTGNDKWTYLHQMFMSTSPDPEDRTPIATIQFLIDQGLDVNAIDSYGNTPLIYAVRQRNVEGIRLLLENGADKLIEHENNDGVSALRMGFDQKPYVYDVFKALLDFGGNPNTQNKNGKTLKDLLDIIADVDPEIHALFKKY